ncbi:MAG: hypothetical protein HC828_21750, partial [Blastochloris sp.]|nr:hypothetical protein [Blastochloris sp.]
AEVERQLVQLPTRAVAGACWQTRGEVAVVADSEAAAALADEYAPEHLHVHTTNPEWYRERLRNYGSLFLGRETTVAYGDKAVGTNHILPTGRAARYTGGLWVGRYIKVLTCSSNATAIAACLTRIRRITLSPHFPLQVFPLPVATHILACAHGVAACSCPCGASRNRL